MYEIKNYIGGQWVPADSGRTLDNYEPATGKVYSLIPDSGKSDVENAVQAAKLAFKDWSKRPASERTRILLAIADGIEKRLDEFAEAESRDTGKPLSLALSVDIPRAISNFRFFATAVTHFHEEAYDMGSMGFNYTQRRAIGVAGLISPWNLPLYLLSWKIAPALAVGNTAVAKPSEITPMTAHLLTEVCNEAGLPPGVLNMVHGLGSSCGDAIVRHPDIPLISFTGGTTTGAILASVAAPMFKKLSLELGGKNASLVFENCDLDLAVETSLRSAFANQGQICLCSSRILVQKSVYPLFLEKFTAKVKELLIPSDPSILGTKFGAVVSKAQLEKVLYYIDLAKKEGGKILTGGTLAPAPNERCANGWFIYPTIVADMDYRCTMMQEEIFGPVVNISSFETEDEAIEQANSVKFGLAAVIWTKELKQAHQVAANLEAGIVWINNWMVRDLRTPFGGVKHSGVGREGGIEALHFYTEPKNIFVGL